MWRKYFKVVNIIPGPVILPGFGRIDFSNDNLTPELLFKIHESKCRYIQITDQGKEKFIGITPDKKSKQMMREKPTVTD